MLSPKTIFLRLAILLSLAWVPVQTVSAQAVQLFPENLHGLLQIPKHYTILKTGEKMIIDGKDNEKAWNRASWTDWFTDIVTGKESSFMGKTRCKMLWDDHYLYVYAQLQETDIHADFKIHDKPVFLDNSFEMYLNPGGSTHNYFEFQMNAYGTTCDLFLPKPYRNGGHPLLSWDLKGLKKAVYIEGTLNNPADTDKYWSIELAVSFTSVVMGRDQLPRAGTIWRMNFSRVAWPVKIKDGQYVPRKMSGMDWASGHYNVWSPQGILDLHFPERWGYVMFSDKNDTSDFLSEKDERMKLILWKYYYLQQIYKMRNGIYAGSVDQLNNTFPHEAGTGNSSLKMEADSLQFWIMCYLPDAKEYSVLNEEGDLYMQSKP